MQTIYLQAQTPVFFELLRPSASLMKLQIQRLEGPRSNPVWRGRNPMAGGNIFLLASTAACLEQAWGMPQPWSKALLAKKSCTSAGPQAGE